MKTHDVGERCDREGCKRVAVTMVGFDGMPATCVGHYCGYHAKRLVASDAKARIVGGYVPGPNRDGSGAVGDPLPWNGGGEVRR